MSFGHPCTPLNQVPHLDGVAHFWLNEYLDLWKWTQYPVLVILPKVFFPGWRMIGCLPAVGSFGVTVMQGGILLERRAQFEAGLRSVFTFGDKAHVTEIANVTYQLLIEFEDVQAHNIVGRKMFFYQVGKEITFLYEEQLQETADAWQPRAAIPPAGWIAIIFGGLVLIVRISAIVVIVRHRNERFPKDEGVSMRTTPQPASNLRCLFSPSNKGNLFQMFIALNLLPGDCRSRDIPLFGYFDRFPSKS
jgi:hypothetical protein